jgi:hypothetical protein
MSMGDIMVMKCKTHGEYTADMPTEGFNKPCPKGSSINKGGVNMKTELQKAIDQIGEEAVSKSIPKGASIGRCQLHGSYLMMADSQGSCPICPAMPDANGTDASDVEHYINVREIVGMDGANPQQR